MTNHSSNKQQTIMTTQQSTWTSVLCSYSRRENENEMAWCKTAQPTTTNNEDDRQRMTNDATINLDLSPLLLQYGGQENNNKVVFESMKRNRVHLRGSFARDCSSWETPRKRLLARDSSRETPRESLLARDSLRETPPKRLLARDSLWETPRERLLVKDFSRETSRERLLASAERCFWTDEME